MPFDAWSWLLGVTGGGLMAAAMTLLVWRLRVRARSVTAVGTITSIHETTDNECPIVTFTTIPHQGLPARTITFRSRHGAPDQRIGLTLPVYYDPASPESATIVSWRMTLTLGGALFAGGLVLTVVGIVLAFVINPAIAAPKDASSAFITAFRRADRAAEAELTDRVSPVIDRALLEKEVPPSQSFRITAAASGASDGCVRGVLEPNHVMIVLFVVKSEGRWRVRRASAEDAECEARLRD